MDINWVRAQFPVFNQDPEMVFMDNAGGSQTVGHAITAISEYLTHYDVQLGASYSTSAQAAKILQQATQAVQTYLNAAHIDEVIVGASSTSLVRILCLSLAQGWQAGDEVIVTDVDHECNRAAWFELEKQGIVVKTWQVNPQTYELETDALLDLMTNSTKLVCFTHVSNILGSINPIEQWTQLIHQHGAQVCVDGVAYAPHRLIDVQAWDVDYYYFSTYKTFGPHQGVMYGKRDLLNQLPGFNHAFIKTSPYKFQPGNVNYELCYAMGAVVQYLCDLGAGKREAEINRYHLKNAYHQIAQYEAELINPLIKYLHQHPAINIIGINQSTAEKRVATLSFVHKNIDSKTIVEHVDPYQIGIRFGDFYAVELINHLGLREKQGVVRVSLAHYNTADEVEKLIKSLKVLFL
ncbi:cysteine desulfurase-like protein [Marinicella sp. S1101]|uniref:cysteine desulfurase-like protein n=1 Tax=Marinicella marina TaxID=2996016 RepID=UPI002260C135|nr:cysteine desulfurase-like protein [Marinicella marina]MCX7552719.1 cysteine desulfurase-like protein [Marinicella marina]MDJ1139972.1 cysteine desulfurase-like protein [Marinicella marina]